MCTRDHLKTVSALGAAVAVLVGCANPLHRTTEQQFRESLIASHQAHLKAVAAGPVIEVRRTPSEVEADLTPQRRAELDEISGMAAYADAPLKLGQNLLGTDEANVVQMSLQQAIETAVRNNLNLQVARLGPAILQTRVTQAEAVFDALFFTEVQWSKLDTPQPSGFIPGLVDNTQSEDFRLSTGIRKDLISGGRITVQTDVSRRQSDPSIFDVNKFYEVDLSLNLIQPVLRGFGADVNRANIVLAESAQRSQVMDLRGNLEDLAAQVEEAYWNVFFTRNVVLIQSRLLEDTSNQRRTLKSRINFDVKPATLTEVSARVEQRRADLIRAQQQVFLTSDALKRLLNSPDLPLSDETLIQPIDEPVEDSLTFSLLDAVTTALRNRVEMQSALLDIKDASVRQRVADNNRLPLLNLTATATVNGIGPNNAGDAYSELGEYDFIDYLLGGRFEMPLGNREAEAFYTQRRLERQATVINYQRQAQDVVLELKNALRDILTTYELIGATRAGRRAAADSLRALQAEEDAGAALTPFFIALKLDRQDDLRNSEVREIQALSEYNNAISHFYQAMGTLLDRNGIAFQEEIKE